jgi:hypothetical protein
MATVSDSRKYKSSNATFTIFYVLSRKMVLCRQCLEGNGRGNNVLHDLIVWISNAQ